MPPTNQKASAARSNKAQDEEQREDVLQAIVLADSYEDSFLPLTADRPRCLLPLANTPLIDYTLEFLVHNGLHDVFVYVGAHADQVEAYLEASRWKSPSPTSPFASLTILRTPASSVGDALRDLDKRDLVVGDFLLVHGDVVSNMLVEPALLRHKSRRVKDKSAIMTLLMHEGRPRAGKGSRQSRPVFVLGPDNRCLHYEELDRSTKFVDIDPDILKANPDLDIRADLLDARIDICAPDVLSLWSDNFDYQSPRASFLSGVLRDFELNGKTIFLDIGKDGYAARVKDIQSYGAIASDVVTRKAYPFTPESNFGEGQQYWRQKGNIHLEPHISTGSGVNSRARTDSGPPLYERAEPPRSVTIGSNSVVGGDTAIEQGSSVASSCIRRQCFIGRNVMITHSHLFDGVTIGDNCQITYSVIGHGAVIGANSTIEDSIVPAYTTIASDTKSSGQPIAAASDDQPPLPSDDRKHLRPLTRAPSSTSLSSVSTLPSRSSSPSSPHPPRSSSIASTSSPRPLSAAETTQTQQPSTPTSATSRAALLADMVASVQDGAVRAQDPDTVRLELMGQRLSGNADDALVRDALAIGLLRAALLLIEPPPASAGDGSDGEDEDVAGAQPSAAPVPAKEAVKQVFDGYGPLLKKMGVFSQADQVAVLGSIERECARKVETGPKVLVFALERLYDGEIVTEEGVLQWWDEGEEGDAVRKLAKAYVEWLQNAESESEEEED